MAEDSPTLDELRQRIADIESGKLPARRKAALKAKTSGLTRPTPLQRKNPTPFTEGQQVVTRAPKLFECDVCHRLMSS